MAEWHLEERQATSQGFVAWRRLGDGPPLVLVHGTPWSSFVWRNLAPALGAQCSVYAFDLPGFGLSEKHDAQDTSLAAQSRVLGELLDAWEVSEPIVVAHDIGGAIALRATLLEGRRFTSLALLDPVALAPWGSPFYRLVREHSDVFAALPPHIHAAVVEAYVRGALSHPLAADVVAALVAPWLDDDGKGAFYRQIAHGDEAHTDEFRGRLERLDCPTLIVWGEADPWIPVERGRELARLIPSAELHVVPEAGHLVQEDAPGDVLRALLPLVTRRR
jgi:pimeloyl-ACP methyl ester carboxylesterase